MLRLRFAALSMTGDDAPVVMLSERSISYRSTVVYLGGKVNGLDQFDRDKGG